MVIAREFGIGLKVIWREEVECGVMCGSMPPFNSTWSDLFSYPNLRLASNFPGKGPILRNCELWILTLEGTLEVAMRTWLKQL